MSKAFVAIVERTDLWDRSREAHEQDGFAAHVAYMDGLEKAGFIAMAGLMLESEDIMFVLVADSAEEVRERFAGDPWQQDGHSRLVRLEEAAFRIGAPAGVSAA